MLNAIPVRGVLGVRIPTIPVRGPICNTGVETVHRTLFGCNFARAAWLSSFLGLKTDVIPGKFQGVWEWICKHFSESDVIRFASIAWAIWRIRNDAVLGGKQPLPHNCDFYFSQTLQLCQAGRSNTLPARQTVQEIPSSLSGPICCVDGSWSPNNGSGIGAVLIKDGATVAWISKSIRAMNASHAESLVVLQGYKLLLAYGCAQGIICSDSIEVADSLAHSQPRIHDWCSFHEVWEAWRLQKQEGNDFRTIHCGREDQQMQLPHLLANWSRTWGWDKEGKDCDLLSLVADGLM